MNNHLLSVLLILITITIVQSKMPKSCDGATNTKSIYDTAPKLINTTANGKFYQTYATDTPINVVHVYGTPYEMGYAHGSLLKKEINQVIPQFEQYLAGLIDDYISFLPKFMRDIIEQEGISAALYATYEMTRYYTPDYWYEEMRGIADGSGISYNRILEMHMFPELIQAACSMVGSWGQATQNADISGGLVQLRALDWNDDGPLQQFPMVLVYHPNQGNGHPFSIVSWAGFVGTISGMSSAPFGVCEKVWLSYKGHQARIGYPWHFMLRDILQYDETVDDAINRISSTARTCSIWIGLGTPEDHFRVVQYSHDYFKVFDDRNFPVYTGHPRFNNTVYVDKHVQPSHKSCLADIIQEHYGSISALTLFQNIAGELRTGDMQVCVYDYTNMDMYVSNASPYTSNGNTKAYDNTFTKFDMFKLFAEKQ